MFTPLSPPKATPSQRAAEVRRETVIGKVVERQRFKSKVDAWLLVILILSVFATLAAAFTITYLSLSNLLIATPILLLGAGLPLWLLLQTHYTFTGPQLVVQSGPFKWKIQVSDVRSVDPTRNPLSSPALSLDRLQIDYGSGKTILVSPTDKEGSWNVYRSSSPILFNRCIGPLACRAFLLRRKVRQSCVSGERRR